MANTGGYPVPPQPPPPPAPAKPSGGWKVILAMFAVLFLVLSVAATACVLTSSTTAQPQSTGNPGDVVQAWAIALEKGDFTTADTYLSASTRDGGMTSSDFVGGEQLSNLIVDGVTTNGSSASVSLHYTTTSGSTFWTSMSMVLENGSWKISGPLY
jgi:hypothetical protein